MYCDYIFVCALFADENIFICIVIMFFVTYHCSSPKKTGRNARILFLFLFNLLIFVVTLIEVILYILFYFVEVVPALQWGTADAEIKVSFAENLEVPKGVCFESGIGPIQNI